MSNDEPPAVPGAETTVDTTLKQQLAAIEQEETPERLLMLARELQRLLRENGA